MEEIYTFIKNALSSEITDQEMLREKLPLETAPFRFAKKAHLNIAEMAKDEERRLAFQALFLLILRPWIPIKCSS
jgi:hypothetical protein